ncbi:hypothetical protein LX78_00559 [Xanthomarina spongicola]|jgi:hypothetical protein|uniref:Uncharacterized protein n=1 Tax=Xanthomarina spongicola TaxID=570520 RepID=A0A316DW94_9FLAO|nr:hypothetical protein LX78_00559 [Xanthomarina spongicola]
MIWFHLLIFIVFQRSDAMPYYMSVGFQLFVHGISYKNKKNNLYKHGYRLFYDIILNYLFKTKILIHKILRFTLNAHF